MKDIEEAEDSWLVEEDKHAMGPFMLIFQGMACAFGLACLFSVLFAQTFKYGQRHPDPQEFMTYKDAVVLANGRHNMGYEEGLKQCR